jgi:glycosyltransferase involved in cell wall biosynthesis
MILIYHSIKPLGETRHQGLFEAYARLVPIIVNDPLNAPRTSLAGDPVPGGKNLPRVGARGLYRTRMRWMFPAGRFAPVSLVQRWLGLAEILCAVRRQAEGRRIILVAQHPTLLPTLRGLPIDLSVYEVRDDYAALALTPNTRRAALRGHRRMLRSSDVVMAISDRLVEDIQPVRPDVQATFVGVEREFFLPSDPSRVSPLLSRIARPRIGTLGNLNDRTDWELLEFLALARPAWNLVVIGPLYMPGPATFEGTARLKRLPNVHFLPAVDRADIPATIAELDVCLIPYRMSAAVERINPLKLYQYLAAGKPVVSSAIPAVKPFSDVVGWTTTREEFLHATDRALQEAADPGRRAQRQGVARRFTWDAVAEHQLRFSGVRLQRTPWGF